MVANHSFAGVFPVCYIQWREELQMSLAERIQKDLVDAMRAKEELRLSVLRGIKAAIKHKEVEKMRAMDEAESIQILQTLVKQRKESIEQFTKGNRPELAEKETKELAIIESYLPAGASEAEMDAAVTKAIAENGANSIKQMGAVVKSAKAALEGKTVDGKVLSDRVRERLSKLG
jgi:uncharacterized protein YqeY